MSQDEEVSLRVRARAEYQELLGYEQAARRVIAVHRELVDTMGDGAGTAPAGATGGHSANTGGPPPSPKATPKGAAGQGAPPAPGAPQSGPPAPPPPAAAATGGIPGQQQQPAGGGQPPVGGGQPQAPPAGGGGGSGTASPYPAGPATPPRRRPSMWKVAAGVGMAGVRRTGGFVSNTLSTAIGVGLGSSVMGLPLTAVNRYMQLSTVLAQIDQRFRDAADGAEMFGTSMGYGINRSAQLAEALGAQMNTFERSEGVRMAGLARYTGADPAGALSSLGHVSALSGRVLSEGDLADVVTTARARHMDQGRIDEFLQRLRDVAEQQFEATGATTMGGALTALSLPSIVYGHDDPRGAHDTSMLGGLHSTLTSGGPMRSYMMRAMGYGTAGGPGYIEMRKQLEGGVFDARNLVDLFGSFQERGMGRGAMFRALESVAGGSLKAHQIEAIVDKLGTEEGLLAYGERSVRPGGSAIDAFKGMLSKSERAAFERGGFGKLGQQAISAGESYQNRIERMMLSVGGELAQGIPNLQDGIESLGRTLQKILGDDLGAKIEAGAGHLESIARFIERNAVPLNQGAVDVVGALPQGMEARVRQGMTNAARVKRVHEENGIGLGLLQTHAEIQYEYWTGQDVNWAPDIGDPNRKAGGGPR